jgi:hypothetical protein
LVVIVTPAPGAAASPEQPVSWRRVKPVHVTGNPLIKKIPAAKLPVLATVIVVEARGQMAVVVVDGDGATNPAPEGTLAAGTVTVAPAGISARFVGTQPVNVVAVRPVHVGVFPATVRVSGPWKNAGIAATLILVVVLPAVVTIV